MTSELAISSVLCCGVQFTVALNLEGEQDLSKSAIHLHWSSRPVQLDQIGELPDSTGTDHLVFDVRNDAAQAVVSATPGFSPVHSGTVAHVPFTALSAGDDSVKATLTASQGSTQGAPGDSITLAGIVTRPIQVQRLTAVTPPAEAQ